MRCPNCGTESPIGKRFCGECGSPLSDRCPKCGAANPSSKQFCGDCGAALKGKPVGATTASAPGLAATRAADQSDGSASPDERKIVTVVFADIKGSMELIEDLDPEQARAIVDPALKLMMDAVHRYGGYVAQSTGDGIFALFGAPIAHEDHPQRALYAALRMQEETRRYSDRLRADGRQPLQVRVGANTGEVVVRTLDTGGEHREYAPIGHATSLAARMQMLAPVGSIAITESTQRLCEGYFSFKPLGPTRVKGASEPINVFEVTGLGALRTRLQASAYRGLSKFVGRQAEMDALRRAQQLANGGHGQIVATVSDAGVGKSRLFFEFKAKNRSGWMVLEAFSVSHGKASAYLPVIDLLHGYFDIKSEDDARKRREKVNGKILTLDRALEDTLPYLFGLLGILEGGGDPLTGMDAAIRRRRTLEALKRILLRESLNQPLMIIFEDLHWIDDETQALLNLLVDSIATAQILLLVNYRPEYSHQWISKTYYTQLRLDPLGRESADEMLGAMLGEGNGDLRALKDAAAARTDGNPFFMEEIVQSLFEQGVLMRSAAGVKLARPFSDAKLPATVQGLLASRIDRLPAAEKELLQTLAVIGKEFPLGLVRRVVARPEDELNRMLSNLQQSEFVYEQPAFPDVKYTFKHALTQEVAYNSVLIERRKALHERIGDALEQIAAGHLEDRAGELAHHYSRGDNQMKAARYLYLAALYSRQRFAYAEAVELARRGLAVLGTEPETPEGMGHELGLRLVLADSLGVVNSPVFPEVAQSYSRAKELAERRGDTRQLFEILMGLRLYYQLKTDGLRMRDIDERLLLIASQQGDPTMLMAAHGHLAASCLWFGELEAARKHGEATLSGPEAEGEFGVASARFIAVPALAHSLWLLGYPEQALRVADELIRSGRVSKSPMATVLSLVRCWDLNRFLRDPGRGREQAEEALAFTSEYGISSLGVWARGCHGRALVELARGDEGLDEIRQIPAFCLQVAMGLRPTISLMLVEAHLKLKQPEAGLLALEDVLVQMERCGECTYEPEQHRLWGELLLLRDPADTAGAEQSFRTAIEIARRQGAKSWELRAATSLARLLRDTDRRDEARSTLAEIYNWFTEGFDTADLKDAKALLDELSG